MVILRAIAAVLLALALAAGPLAAQPAKAPPPPEQPAARKPNGPKVGSSDVLIGAGIGVLAGVLLVAIIVAND